MADEVEAEGGSRKRSIFKLVAIVVGALVTLALVVGLTLFLTGFFEQAPEQSVEALLEAAEAETEVAAGRSSGPPSGPPRVPRRSPDRERFEQSYLELERNFLANVSNSRKLIQVSLALMTHFDQRVFQNVIKHEFAIRSAVLDEMRLVTESQIEEPNFRVDLAERIRLRINEILEQFEDFGGIEQVHFTEFIVQ